MGHYAAEMDGSSGPNHKSETTYTPTDMAIMKAAFDVGVAQRALETAEKDYKRATNRLRGLMDLKDAAPSNGDGNGATK